MGSPSNARRVFIALILLALVLVAWIMGPFAEAFIFATVLAATLYPLHEKLLRRLGNRPQLSAAFLCAAVVLAVLLPLGGLVAFIVNEIISAVHVVSKIIQTEGARGLVEHVPDSIRSSVDRVAEAFSLDRAVIEAELQKRASQHTGQLAGWVSGALGATGRALLQTTMMMIALFFLLVDGPELVTWIENRSPLMKGQARELLLEFRRVSASVLISSVATSALQALIAFVGYLIVGVPRPAFFGLMTFFIAFVPAVGAGGVCLVAALLMLGMGHPWAALFLAIWGTVAVGLVDNLIRPLLVKRGLHMHGAVVFFSLLGGMAVFGAVGLVLGPLIVTFLLALVRIYSRDFGSSGASQGILLPGEDRRRSHLSSAGAP